MTICMTVRIRSHKIKAVENTFLPCQLSHNREKICKQMTIILLVNVSFGQHCCDLNNISLRLAYQVLPTRHSYSKGNKTNLPSIK